jgi:prepilin-type N-terminal cleavage/methylation domain-containing protein
MRIRRSISAGFTLIEILVVIAIIALLAALLAVGVVGMRRRAQNEKTRALIRKLDIGCKTYYERYIGYPPAHSPTNPQPGFGAFGWNHSAVLLWYLGTPKPIMTGGNVVMAHPVVDFKRDDIQPSNPSEIGGNPAPTSTGQAWPVVDAWGRRISYRNPGSNHATVVNPGVHDKGRDHTKHVDMWAWGADGGSRGPTGVGTVNTIMYTDIGAGAESGGYPASGYGQDDIANWYEK